MAMSYKDLGLGRLGKLSKSRQILWVLFKSQAGVGERGGVKTLGSIVTEPPISYYAENMQ